MNQSNGPTPGLSHIHREVTINAPRDRVWQALSQYGDVSRFHAGVDSSVKVEGSGNQARAGCERVCNIVDLGLHISLKERIVDFVEGESYQYEVYEWKNFPLHRMLFRFTIGQATATHTTLAVDIDFRARPGFLTPLMGWKMKSLAADVLLGYRHYIETGQERVPIAQLRTRYRRHAAAEVQHA